MKRSRGLAILVTIVAFCIGCNNPVETEDTITATAAETAKPDAQSSDIYSVAEYDPTADPVVDLTQTVQQAQKDGKRIILEIGGEW